MITDIKYKGQEHQGYFPNLRLTLYDTQPSIVGYHINRVLHPLDGKRPLVDEDDTAPCPPAMIEL